MVRIKVELGKRSYPVIVGSGIADRLQSNLTRQAGDGRIFALYDAQVYALYGRNLSRLLGGVGRVSELVIPPGEGSKSDAQLGRIYDFLLHQQISRSDTIVACGGGVTSDLAGFAAATTLRGIGWVVIPTTLMGMVDAAIGGKTAINHPAGKNLIGAFWQPSLVWCDLEYLMTLPRRHMIGGLGEILKYAGLVGTPLVKKLTDYLSSADLYDLKRLEPIITDCVKYKARLVKLDETDCGQRMMLNLGHTFGHAIEAGGDFRRLHHGEALILGLKAAVYLSAQAEPAGTKALAGYSALIDSFVKQVRRCRIDISKTFGALKLDKKRRGRHAKFILLRKPASPYIADDISIAVIRKSLKHTLSGFDLSGELND